MPSFDDILNNCKDSKFDVFDQIDIDFFEKIKNEAILKIQINKKFEKEKQLYIKKTFPILYICNNNLSSYMIFPKNNIRNPIKRNLYV